MRSFLSVHWKDWCWSWNSTTLATWCEELTHLKTPWSWERLKAGGEGDDRMRWLDGITNSMTWVWVKSGSWWWTGRPCVLQFMGSQRVGHDSANELNWTELVFSSPWSSCCPKINATYQSTCNSHSQALQTTTVEGSHTLAYPQKSQPSHNMRAHAAHMERLLEHLAPATKRITLWVPQVTFYIQSPSRQRGIANLPNT